MGEFDHLVLTRYSVVQLLDQEPAPEEWLRYRLGFFREACLASMTSQTVDRFRWLVFADDRCSDGFRDELGELADGVFEPVWGHELFWNAVRAAVAERAHAPYLITTRLDSDDAVARDFVELTQAQFDRQERMYVNFASGLQVERSGAVYSYLHRANPFQSLVERRDAERPPFTVYGAGEHAGARNHGPLTEVRTPPMWLQVVHGGNVANDIRGPRVSPAVVARRFDLDLWYDADVGRVRLLAGRVTSTARLLFLLARRRALLSEAVTTRLSLLRGTHVKPQRTPRQVARSQRRRERHLQRLQG